MIDDIFSAQDSSPSLFDPCHIKITFETNEKTNLYFFKRPIDFEYLQVIIFLKKDDPG